ncbi:MAG: protein kinase, partial [Candidatus Eremiobacteraeota bacterium]|nr:protein kinase [Candidatus Eremiobacteraeota bacterium]
MRFYTDPPGANVERLDFEGNWNYIGVADGEPVSVELSPVEAKNSLRLRFVFPSAGDDPWRSEDYEVSGQDFLRSGRFPKDGPLTLDVPGSLRWRLWASSHPLLGGLLIFGVPTLLLTLFLTRRRLLSLLRSSVGVATEERFTGYNVLGELGKGAMGVVYLGEDQGGLKVAIKSVLPEYAEDPEFEKRFEHEVRACVSLKHPNLLRYYGHGVDSQGVPFSVTELLEGRTLKQVLAGGVPHPNRLASD